MHAILERLKGDKVFSSTLDLSEVPIDDVFSGAFWYMLLFIVI